MILSPPKITLSLTCDVDIRTHLRIFSKLRSTEQNADLQQFSSCRAERNTLTHTQTYKHTSTKCIIYVFMISV